MVQESASQEKRLQGRADNTTAVIPNQSVLMAMLKENKMNGFSFVEELKVGIHHLSEESLEELLANLTKFIFKSDLTESEKTSATQSYEAFMAVKEGATREEQEFISESESDNPQDWVHLKHACATDSV